MGGEIPPYFKPLKTKRTESKIKTNRKSNRP